jgi:sialate O-acetylesterase
MLTARRLALALALIVAGTVPAWAKVQLPPVISANMVLQRDMAVPIWGTAAAGEKVTVKFRDQEKSVTADAQGKWRVKLDALRAGGPDVMTVAGENTLTLNNVLVGEVWVGSGQSNMAGAVKPYAKGDPVLAALATGGPYPRLRLMRPAGWQEATPESIEAFSALLFSFGLPLQQKLDVPVGLLVGAVGGTPSGYWLSEEAYKADADCAKVVAKYALTYSFEDAQKKHQEEMKKYEEAKAAWDKQPEEARKDKRAPRPPAPPLKPGECRAKIGHLYAAHIQPFIPYAIRGVLWDQGESGTAIQGVDQCTLMGALIRGWRAEWGQGEFPFIYVQKPSGGGCAWDPEDAVTNKAEKFAPLPATVPAGGEYRENHIRIMLAYPRTYMVTASDLGSGVHPVNKSGYGARACRVALGAVYGEKVEICGPVYASHKVDGAKVRVAFAHLGQGLAVRHAPKLQGFALAGADKGFKWADAAVETADGVDTIVLSSKDVPQPVYVRYAWAANAPWANLFNKDGLPAIPFRTDE